MIKSGEIDWEGSYKQHEKIVLGINERSFRGQRKATTITVITNHRLLAVLKESATGSEMWTSMSERSHYLLSQ